MAKTVYDVLIQKFQDDVTTATEFLSNGGGNDFAQYREIVGRIRGLRLAIQTTQDLLRSQMEEEDND